jgi:hypothetical protein
MTAMHPFVLSQEVQEKRKKQIQPGRKKKERVFWTDILLYFCINFKDQRKKQETNRKSVVS